MAKNKIIKDITTFIKKDEVLGQIGAAVPRGIISMFLTELGNKTLFTLAGLIGNIANENLNKSNKKKTMIRAMLTNWMLTFMDPTPNQTRELKRNISNLKAGIASRNFSSAFGSLIAEPAEVVGAIKSMVPRFSSIKFGKRFSMRGSTMQSPLGVKELTPKLTNRYSSILDESKIITY